jgi:hypothetical protein
LQPFQKPHLIPKHLKKCLHILLDDLPRQAMVISCLHCRYRF